MLPPPVSYELRTPVAAPFVAAWLNRSGSLEFVVPATDPNVFFPIEVRFTSPTTFCDVKVLPSTPYCELCSTLMCAGV